MVFYSIEDIAGGFHLPQAENILRNETKTTYEDINDILELYSIKKYIDNDLYLKKWTQNDILVFKDRVIHYSRIVTNFMSSICEYNFITYYEQLWNGYVNLFWELVDKQSIFKRVSAGIFDKVLNTNPQIIKTILSYKNLVANYRIVIKDFLLSYQYSAEILLSFYLVKKETTPISKTYLPDNLTLEEKENIISQYVGSVEINLNYLRLIINAKKRDDFIISDRTRLKAKRREKEENDRMFTEGENAALVKYSVRISFSEITNDTIDIDTTDSVINYTYNLNYIKQYNDIQCLFSNFTFLFEYLDYQYRINLVSKTSELGVLERFTGIHSHKDYRRGIVFNLSEMTSHAQIVAYYNIIIGLGESLENILQCVFTSLFHENYQFASNAQLSMPSASISFFEKVTLLAPQLERVLKQYQLFVEEGSIDFELLQISSKPNAIKDIPSLVPKKYIYLNDKNKEIVNCSYLFFSDQTVLGYVEPYEEKNYHNFFDLLINEQVQFNKYEEFQKQKVQYLIDNGYIIIDKNGFIQITNVPRVLILKDLYENEVGAYNHYPAERQNEANQMKTLDMVYFEKTLFSKPEQSYFNYLLNKSEFTNGLDLRNSYVHGTQPNPEELQKHEYAYFTYLKLLVLVLLKIEDDLFCSQINKDN